MGGREEQRKEGGMDDTKKASNVILKSGWKKWDDG